MRSHSSSVAAATAGVPLDQLRAAVALAKLRGGDAAVHWPSAVWCRLWSRLSPVQQRVVYLHVFAGVTIAEAAAELGVRRASAAAVFARALERIRDLVPRSD